MSTAAEAAASHRALDAPVLAIEGARTHAPAISTGVAAVFPAFQHAQPAVSCTRAPRRARRTACRTSICHASARMLNTNTQKSTAVIHENSGGHPEMGVVQTAGARGFESRLAPRLFFGSQDARAVFFAPNYRPVTGILALPTTDYQIVTSIAHKFPSNRYYQLGNENPAEEVSFF